MVKGIFSWKGQLSSSLRRRKLGWSIVRKIEMEVLVLVMTSETKETSETLAGAEDPVQDLQSSPIAAVKDTKAKETTPVPSATTVQ